jgi:hypothetical protein
LLVYPTVEAPRFPKGYPYSAANVICLVIMTQIVRILFNREEYVLPPSRGINLLIT